MRNIILAFALLSSLLACTQASAQEQIVLEAASDQSTFMVEITWTPDDIGNANAFDIRFIEPETGEEIEDIKYDFSIYSGDNREELRRDQTATRQEFTFDEQGSYEIRIDDIEGLGERVTIPIQVTPEFPLGALALIASAFGAAVLIARHNSNNLFRQ
ncbi:MAG: DUF6941 family protein [Nitrososphaera sp.]